MSSPLLLYRCQQLLIFILVRRGRLLLVIVFNPERKATDVWRATPTPHFNVDRATSGVLGKNLLRIER